MLSRIVDAVFFFFVNDFYGFRISYTGNTLEGNMNHVVIYDVKLSNCTLIS